MRKKHKPSNLNRVLFQKFKQPSNPNRVLFPRLKNRLRPNRVLSDNLSLPHYKKKTQSTKKTKTYGNSIKSSFMKMWCLLQIIVSAWACARKRQVIICHPQRVIISNSTTFYLPKGLCEAEPYGLQLTVFPFYNV